MEMEPEQEGNYQSQQKNGSVGFVTQVDLGLARSDLQGGQGGHPLDIIQEFQAWRRKIKPLLDVLSRVPQSELEERICASENDVDSDENRDDPLLKDVPSLASQCKALYEQLVQEVNGKREEADNKWTRILALWEELKTKERVQLTFTNGETGIIRALDELTAQLELRKKEGSLRIEEFVKELRNEISVIWDLCMITEEEKAVFKEFNVNEFTEEMLEIHTEELKKWQIYHKKNQEILTKIKKRDEMWTRLRELESRADDPNRFVNRGGTLLKDQNMHNSITKNLPKLEAELIKLAEKFEKEHGRKMTILGKQIPCMIDQEWIKFRTEKAARKLQRTLPDSNATNTIGLMKAPLKSRQSIMPVSSVRPSEKRPATRLMESSHSPLKKLPKFSSVESVKSNESDKN